jgi:hypothetical protein
MTSVGLGAGWSKERSLLRQPEAPFKHLHALRSMRYDDGRRSAGVKQRATATT